MRDVQIDEEGNKIELTGSDRLYPADTTIVAVSQGPKDKIVNSTQGIDVNKIGLIIADEHGETTRPGIFASGDVVNGAKTVVEAVHYSKEVADAMDKYMQSIEIK